MNYEDMNPLCKRFIRAAQYSRGDNNHWIRYLSKVITDDEIRFTDEDVNILLSSDELDESQKKILQQAVIKGSDIYESVVTLNRPISDEYIHV